MTALLTTANWSSSHWIRALRAADPDVGYKDDFDIVDWLHAAGLTLVEVVEMPANNLAFVSERATET